MEQGEVLQMHVGVAGEEAEEHLLVERDDVQLEVRCMARNGLHDLLMRTPVLVFGLAFSELAHVLHVQLLHLAATRLAKAIHAARDIRERSILHGQQAMRNGAYAAQFREVHGEVLQLHHVRVVRRGWLQDVAAPRAKDREPVGRVG